VAEFNRLCDIAGIGHPRAGRGDTPDDNRLLHPCPASVGSGGGAARAVAARPIFREFGLGPEPEYREPVPCFDEDRLGRALASAFASAGQAAALMRKLQAGRPVDNLVTETQSVLVRST
jgi:hypothetical protein